MYGTTNIKFVYRMSVPPWLAGNKLFVTSNVGRGDSETSFKFSAGKAVIKGRGNYENLYAVCL
jgi:hypothetical protein